MCNKNRDVSFLNTALITILLLASTLSAQDHSEYQRSGTSDGFLTDAAKRYRVDVEKLQRR
jgi:hypothetical protein